ncbi:TPA: transposase [Raoultella ornithinolytica]
MNINSVWEFSGVDGIRDGRYRVLAIYFELEICIIFPLCENSTICRLPTYILISLFEQSASIGECKECTITTPFFMTMDECNIAETYRAKRDSDYALIQPLVDDPLFLLDISMKKRNKRLTDYAAEQKIYTNKLYRKLNRYWFYGQERNGLLPSWANCGGRDKIRISGKVKRGAPIQQCPFMKIESFSRNVTEEDKAIFLKGIHKHGRQNERWSISTMYEKIKSEFYQDEIKLAQIESREPCLPSERSFRYWIKKIMPEAECIERQVSTKDFLLRKRGLKGSATDNTTVPGSCFELDATVLDVHIVSSFNRQWVLGRPTLYLVVDKESRMIVGLHVSMEYASWRAGRQALVNSFSDKKQYCARFGIHINDEDWPCHHIPQKLLCDRGEFICQKPEEIVVPLIGNLSIAPPWRPDMKGIVERRFKILNDELIHNLMGTTKGRHYIRGDKDPRRDACFTLDEVTALLIEEVILHNNSIVKNIFRQSKLLLEYSLPPTPHNYWNIHLKLHRHALRHASEAEIRAKLLPCRWVSMTSRGIRLNDDMYYECDLEQFEALKVIARHSGRMKLEARVDQDDSSFIFVKLDESQPFTKCFLMVMSSNFNNQHIADIEVVMAWRKNVISGRNISTSNAERKSNQQQTINQSTMDFKRNKTEKHSVNDIKNIKKHRKMAVDLQRNGYSGIMWDLEQSEKDHKKKAKSVSGIRSQSEVVEILKRKR